MTTSRLTSESSRLLRDNGNTTDLTARHLDVLRHAAAGDTTAETASALFLSAETVKTHREQACRALAARNITHAVALAYESGQL